MVEAIPSHYYRLIIIIILRAKLLILAEYSKILGYFAIFCDDLWVEHQLHLSRDVAPVVGCLLRVASCFSLILHDAEHLRNQPLLPRATIYDQNVHVTVVPVFFVFFILFNHETTWIEIAIETAVGGGELQDAVVRVGHTAGIVLCVAIVPDHLFRGCIRQYLHRAPQHHSLEAFGIAEIDAGLGVGLVLSHTYRKCVGCKVEGFDTLTLAWLQHSLGPRKTFLVY